MSPTARRLPFAERHAQLLAVAAALLEAEGSDGVRMDALARAAGVTRPVVYEHFANRDALLVALTEQHGLRLARAMEAQGDAAAGDFEADLRRSVRAYLDAVVRHGGALRSLMSTVGVSPAVERARADIWNRAIDTWTDRYRATADLDPADARALAEFHLHGLWALAGRCAAGEADPSHIEDLHVTIVLASLHALTS